MSNRTIKLEGMCNLRDMGGMITKNGKIVKKGLIFRSDELLNATENDFKYLASIPIKVKVDFRSHGEVAAVANPVPTCIKKNINLFIGVDNKLEDLASKLPPAKIMEEVNRMLVKEYAYVYREFFEILQNNTENTPIMFHCTAGKDRTGLAAALIYYSLGVDIKQILEDYILSKQNVIVKYKLDIKNNPDYYPFYVVEYEYLNAAFDEINKLYGSIDQYLQNELLVDLKHMKNTFLTGENN